VWSAYTSHYEECSLFITMTIAVAVAINGCHLCVAISNQGDKNLEYEECLQFACQKNK
jgi:hypothetical protein